MRMFREQFQECTKNGVNFSKKLEKPMIIESAFYGPFSHDTIIWCKRFEHQCHSGVCFEFRKSINLN